MEKAAILIDTFTAAVLLLIVDNDKILFIKRAEHLRNHAGEVSFPGGKFDKNADKNLTDTAIREAKEEIGITNDRFRITGKLPPEYTVSTNFKVYTYIAEVKNPVKWNINKKEVDRILLVPIAHLQNAKFKVKVPIKIKGKQYLNTFYYYKNYLIWGATSRILDNFLNNYA